MATKYRLNVDPDVEHELSDAEVRDLRSFGFQVTRVTGKSAASNSSGNNQNQEG
ncbi:hypothetical protein WHI96_07915 [Pseudonocardia tropica]|uniref:Uncharacterized protein n=1 Tax=Pseudonocardia tropica TaxID=681289 RepID=A0ABV1JS28_9PSEU